MNDRERQRLDDIVGRVVAGELDAQQVQGQQAAIVHLASTQYAGDNTLCTPAAQGWQQATQEVLRPHHPFELHQQAFQQVYSTWPEQRGPAPVWVPTTNTVRSSNAARFMQQLQVGLGTG
jgi:hypothetical protein